MKINRHLQGCRSDANRVVPDKVLQRGSFPLDERGPPCLNILGNGYKKKKKALTPESDGFNFNTGPLNCNMFSVFSHQCCNLDFNQEQAKACNNIKKAQRSTNPSYR